MQVDDLDLRTPETPVGAGKDDKWTPPSREQWEATQRERDEARDSERYWSGMARNGGRPAAAAVEPEEEDDPNEFIDEEAAGAGVEGDTPAKLVDELAAQGVSAIAKRGFITAKDAQRIAAEVAMKVSKELIGRATTKATSDAQIMTAFPELKDQSSELFKETAKRYQRAVAMDPNAKKTPAALYLAAEAASEALKAKAPARGRRAADDDYDSEPEVEGDRRRRAESQDSRPRGRGSVQDDDDMIGDQAREVLRQMGLTDDEFKASVKATGAGRSRSRR